MATSPHRPTAHDNKNLLSADAASHGHLNLNNISNCANSTLSQAGFSFSAYYNSDGDAVGMVHQPSNLVAVHQRRAQFLFNAAVKKAEQSMLSVLSEAAGNTVADQISVLIRDPFVPTTAVALAITEAVLAVTTSTSTTAAIDPPARSVAAGAAAIVSGDVLPSNNGSGDGGEASQSPLDENTLNNKADLTLNSAMVTGVAGVGGGGGGGGGGDVGGGADHDFMEQIRSLQYGSPGSSVARSPAPTSLQAAGLVTPPGSPGPSLPPSTSNLHQQQNEKFERHEQQQLLQLQQQQHAWETIQKLLVSLLPLVRPNSFHDSGAGNGSGASTTGSTSGGAMCSSGNRLGLGSGAGAPSVSGLPHFITPHPPSSSASSLPPAAPLAAAVLAANNNYNMINYPSSSGGLSANRLGVVTTAASGSVGGVGSAGLGVGSGGLLLGATASTTGGVMSTMPSMSGLSMRIQGGMSHKSSAMMSIYARGASNSMLTAMANRISATISSGGNDSSGGGVGGVVGGGGMTATMSMMSMADSVRSVSRAAVAHTSNVVDTIDSVGMRYLNNYLILDSCGSGTQGQVYCCLDTLTNEYRAIKVMMRPSSHALLSGGNGTMAARALRESMETAKRLATEVKILSRCRHPSIVQMFEFIDDPTREEVFLVMQYVEHGALLRCDNDGNANRTFSVDTFLNYARQICSGLHYLHKRGIAHRDVRGENILVGALDRIVLADFGVSDMWLAGSVGKATSAAAASSSDDANLTETEKLLAQLEQRIAAVYGTGRRCGTTAFLAPELMSDSSANSINSSAAGDSVSAAPLSSGGGSGAFDAPSSAPIDSAAALYAADVWALGLLFHLMLYGALPFPCTNAAEYIENIVGSAFELPRTTKVVGRDGEPEVVPRNIRIILSRMLHRDPSHRATIGDIRVAFKEVIRQKELESTIKAASVSSTTTISQSPLGDSSNHRRTSYSDDPYAARRATIVPSQIDVSAGNM